MANLKVTLENGTILTAEVPNNLLNVNVIDSITSTSTTSPASANSVRMAVEQSQKNLDAAIADIKLNYGTLGVNQKWQDVTTSRVYGTTYTNTTLKPIFVSIGCYINRAEYKTCELLVDDIIASSYQVSNYSQIGNARSLTLSVIVPSNSTYVLSSPDFNPSIQFWSELR